MKNDDEFFKNLMAELKRPLSEKEIAEREAKEKAYLKEKELHEKVERDAVITKNFGSRYIDASFENFEIYNDNQKLVISECKKYLDNSKSKGESLMLVGSCGTGKDHLIVSMAKTMNNYIATNLEDIAEKKRAAQNTKKTWQEAIKDYCDCKHLILLDFAIRGVLTDSQKEVFAHIVDERYKNMKPMIISTNLDIRKIKDVVDFPGFPRVTDRFREMFKGRILLCNWESYRGR